MNKLNAGAAAVLQCEGLSKTFSEGILNVEVLRGIDFAVAPGERVAIVGSSGSGKSTLLHLLGGLDLPTSGWVKVLDQDISKLSEAGRGHVRNQV